MSDQGHLPGPSADGAGHEPTWRNRLIGMAILGLSAWIAFATVERLSPTIGPLLVNWLGRAYGPAEAVAYGTWAFGAGLWILLAGALGILAAAVLGGVRDGRELLWSSIAFLVMWCLFALEAIFGMPLVPVVANATVAPLSKFIGQGVADALGFVALLCVFGALPALWANHAERRFAKLRDHS